MTDAAAWTNCAMVSVSVGLCSLLLHVANNSASKIPWSTPMKRGLGVMVVVLRGADMLVEPPKAYFSHLRCPNKILAKYTNSYSKIQIILSFKSIQMRESGIQKGPFSIFAWLPM